MATKPENMADSTVAERRAVLKKFGRFAAITAPAVTLLLAAQTKPVKAAALSVPPA